MTVDSSTYGGTVSLNLDNVLIVAPVQVGPGWFGQVAPLTGSASLIVGPGHPTRADFAAYAVDLLDVIDG
ncbi:MAG: hypothetical protein L0I76_24435 [Pseudonocardia sp.]|nr:hypothetical protein [Pseudonocardia sp.]